MDGVVQGRRGTTLRSGGATLAAILASVLALVTAGAQGASLGGESWYDAEHGWRIHNSNIQESNDGGLIWRNVLAHPLTDTNLNGVLRTGLRAGLYYEGGTRGYTVQWTNDGRQFFSSPQLRQPATGAGRFLFFWTNRSLYRVSPWPFPSKCVASTSSGQCLHAPSKGKKRMARFNVASVGAVPEGIIGSASTVPGGVIAVSHAAAKPSVLEARWLRRSGGAQVTSSALPTSENVTLDSCGAQGPFVDWPVIVIQACSLDAGNLVPAGYWQTSNDGGSWQYQP